MEAVKSYPRYEFDISRLEEYRHFLREYGFIHFRNFVPKGAVDGILSTLKEIEQGWLQKGLTKMFGIPILYGKDVDGRKIVQRFPFVTLCHPYFNRFFIKRKLYWIRKVIGRGYRIGKNENDGVVSTHYINTEGKSSLSKMGWHTDSARDFAYLRKMQPFYNVGIHLDNCPKENGGLRVLARTQNQNLTQMLFRKLYFVNNQADPNETVIEVNSGDLTIHSGKMWHRVAQSQYVGENSRRRVIYFPFVIGKKKIKTDESWTPIYMKILSAFAKLV